MGLRENRKRGSQWHATRASACAPARGTRTDIGSESPASVRKRVRLVQARPAPACVRLRPPLLRADGHPLRPSTGSTPWPLLRRSALYLLSREARVGASWSDARWRPIKASTVHRDVGAAAPASMAPRAINRSLTPTQRNHRRDWVEWGQGQADAACSDWPCRGGAPTAQPRPRVPTQCARRAQGSARPQVGAAKPIRAHNRENLQAPRRQQPRHRPRTDEPRRSRRQFSRQH
jgi:hypothetical protein